jgi:UDP-glucose 4-epimerase
MAVLVVGGAGFIGSVLIKKLVSEGKAVVVIDKLSLGKLDYIDASAVKFYHEDINNIEKVSSILKGESYIEAVWHLAANSDIPAGIKEIDVDLFDTFMSTVSILKIMKRLNCKKLYFASSSAVYGVHDEKLYEDIGPLMPISNYGAMKLASEALISASLESFLDTVSIFRFPNVVGIPATHGVVLDFVRRLGEDSSELKVLGNGTQQKIYIHVDELTNAMLFINENASQGLNYFNIGPEDLGVSVKTIAEETVKRVAPNAKITYQKSDKGWVGDVPRFSYSVDKLKSLGWQPKFSSIDAVIKAIDQIAKQEGY